jgi:hypothetical protein
LASVAYSQKNSSESLCNPSYNHKYIWWND